MIPNYDDNADIFILGFLWKWKLSTTAALCFRFFGKIKPHSAYKRLKKLERLGLIQMVPDARGKKFFWTLTRKGFEQVRPHVPSLAQEGYRSEHIFHDHLVTAFHLGDWLSEMPAGAKVFTEQQLRRYHPSEYPSWISQDQTHRPDGYWKIDAAVVALEVELSKKPERHYFAIGQYYDALPEVAAVLWLVPSKERAKSLIDCFQKAQCSKIDKHHFVMLSHFEKLGWNAPFSLGTLTAKPVSAVLGRIEGGSWEEPPAKLLLNSKKWIAISNDYVGSSGTTKTQLPPIGAISDNKPQ